MTQPIYRNYWAGAPSSKKSPSGELTLFQAKWLERQLALINKSCIGSCGIKPSDSF